MRYSYLVRTYVLYVRTTVGTPNQAHTEDKRIRSNRHVPPNRQPVYFEVFLRIAEHDNDMRRRVPWVLPQQVRVHGDRGGGGRC